MHENLPSELPELEFSSYSQMEIESMFFCWCQFVCHTNTILCELLEMPSNDRITDIKILCDGTSATQAVYL